MNIPYSNEGEPYGDMVNLFRNQKKTYSQLHLTIAQSSERTTKKSYLYLSLMAGLLMLFAVVGNPF
jgi:hypothetical protein